MLGGYCVVYFDVALCVMMWCCVTWVLYCDFDVVLCYVGIVLCVMMWCCVL